MFITNVCKPYKLPIQKKKPSFFFENPIFFYFCNPFRTVLSDGVMVALQILVLPVKVRILVGQLTQQSLLLCE